MRKNPIGKIIGENIVRVCREKGISFDSLCEKTGARPETMEKWLTGYRCITVYGLHRTAKAVDCTMDELNGIK